MPHSSRSSPVLTFSKRVPMLAVTINSRFKAYWSAILSHCPASGVPARTRLAEVRRNECLSSSRTPGLRLLSSRPALSLLLSEASNPCHDADEHLYTSHPAVGIFWGEARYLENIRGARGCGLGNARAADFSISMRAHTQHFTLQKASPSLSLFGLYTR